MDEMLARFLGKGSVVDAPMPTYPVYPPWNNKMGRGVYELHIRRDGKVEEVKILRSSGDATFDDINSKAFRKWQFARGPVIVELPLSFTLTPTSYSVKVR